MAVSDAKLRESIADGLAVMSTYAENAINFLTIADDKGAEYAIKKAAAHFKQAVDFLSELKKRNMTQAKEELYAVAQPARRPVRDQQARPNGTSSPEPRDAGAAGDIGD
jgi:hypothetical protein